MKSLNPFETGVLVGLLIKLKKELSLPASIVESLSLKEQFSYEYEINVIDKAIKELIPKGEDWNGFYWPIYRFLLLL